MTDLNISQLLLEGVRRHADKPALMINGETNTYKEFLDIAFGVTQQLINTSQENQRVGITGTKSLPTYAAILGTMLSGACFIPLDPRLGRERLMEVVIIANISTILVDNSMWSSVSLDFKTLVEGNKNKRVKIVQVPTAPVTNSRKRNACTRAAEEAATFDSLCYIFFSSGTTGLPKGIPISRDMIGAYIRWIADFGDVTSEDNVSQMSGLSFDFSFHDYLLAWTTGASLVGPTVADHLLPLKFLRRYPVTCSSGTPSIVSRSIEKTGEYPSIESRLRLTMFGGEALPVTLAKAWRMTFPHTRLINLYGPTESMVFSTYYEYTGDERMDERMDEGDLTVPIGQPLPDISINVNNDSGEPEATPSELLISGKRVFGGYIRTTDNNAAFYRDSDAKTWYRTGDLVSANSAGDLVYRGRTDDQLKFNGCRANLTDLEALAKKAIGAESVALVPHYSTSYVDSLILVVTKDVQISEVSELASAMPDYAIPARIVRVDDIPVTGNAKIDRKALDRMVSTEE